MASVADAVVPGQRLGHVQEYIPGAGTYAHQDFLYASVVGIKQITTDSGEVPLTFYGDVDRVLLQETALLDGPVRHVD
jgi:exosome complex RNA-binding protein Csl4